LFDYCQWRGRLLENLLREKRERLSIAIIKADFLFSVLDLDLPKAVKNMLSLFVPFDRVFDDAIVAMW